MGCEMAKTRVTLNILGKEYTIVGDDPEEYIQRVGLYVDKCMREIAEKSTRVNTATVSILAAINIADQYYKSKESESEIQKELNDSRREIERLNTSIKKADKELGILSMQRDELKLSLAKKEAELAEVRSNIKNKYSNG